jgi:pimeloyl-ACP methyl ester carboxylesterase
MQPSRKSRLAAVISAALALTLILPPEPSVAAVPAGTEVSFTGGGGVRLHGTVFSPREPDAARTAIVLQGGSSWETRDDLRLQAEMFAGIGVTTLVYDRRTAGYSKTRRDYGLLADDLLGAVEVLRGRPEVDPARVGVWGVSEGGWVAPRAASRSPHVSFVITVGASALGGARQTAWFWQNVLRHQGITGSMIDSVSYTGTRFAVASGLFPEADYDPIPIVEKLRQPLLALWGEHDINHPPEESAKLFADALKRGRNSHYAIRAVPGGGPDLELTTDSGYDKLDSLAPAYPGIVRAWLVDPAAEPVIDQAPAQDRATVALPPLSWYESLWLEGLAFLVFIVAFAACPGFALVAKARGKRLRVPPSARWSAIAGASAVAGFVGYFGFLQVHGMGELGVIVLGRPIPWLVLQLLAVATVVATIVTARVWWRDRGLITGSSRVLLTLQLVAGGVFVPWALYWGLLLP